MIRPVASVLARRRAVGVVGVAVLIGTLLTTTGVAAQQEDLPKLSISPTTVVVNENVSSGKVVFTASLSETSTDDVTFGYYLRGDDEAEHRATLGEDFDNPPGSTGRVTITAGQRSATIEVEIIDDAIDEFDEGFALEPSNLTNAEFSDDIAQYYDEDREFLRGHWVTVTIRDDDDPPELTLRTDENSTTESGRLLRYQLSLSEPSGRPVRVKYEVLPGLKRVDSNDNLIDLADNDCGSFTDRDACQPATPREDYGENLWSDQAWSEDNSTLVGEYVFEPGETSLRNPGSSVDFAEIRIDVVNDTDVDVGDRDETLTVRLLPDPSFEFATDEDKSAEGLILDDDLPRVSLNQWGTGWESDYKSQFGVGISPAVPTGGDPVTVKYRNVDDIYVEPVNPDEGLDRVLCTADAGQDYTPFSGEFTFNPGEREKSIEYFRIDDSLREDPQERICVELYDVSQNALLELHPFLYNTLLDNEDPPIATVTSPTADEGDGTITFAVTLRSGASQPTVLTYETADGTAQASSDYTSRSGTLTFPAETTGPLNVSVLIINDTLDEPNENFKLLVLAGSEKLAEGTGTIVDNDGAPLLSVADVRADEDNTDGEIEFTVRLSGVSARQVTVDYRTADGTATAPDDYTAETGSLTFDPGDREMKIPVTIYDDSAYEGNETLTLTLSNALNAEFSRQTATGTIVDDEEAPSLSVENVTGEEIDGTLEFEVTLGSESGSTVTVDYETEQLTATGGESCATGVDYLEVSPAVQLTFNAGVVTQSVFVSLCSDNLDEASETFRLKLSNESGAPVSGRTATGTILDSDDPPELSVAAVAPVAEGAGPMQFTVTLSTASAKTVTVRYATADDTATGGSNCTSGRDYRNKSGTLTFRPGESLTQPVEVQICDDSLDEEETEDFTLTLTVNERSNATLQFGGETATGTITDDDLPPSLSFLRDVTAAENAGSMVFTVELSAASDRIVEVMYSTADDTATAGQDYTALTNETLRFAPGDLLRKTIAVEILNDVLDEADAETFTLELHDPPINATLSASPLTATGTITDNDAATAELSVLNVSATEGGTVTFEVTLTTAKDSEVMVSYETVTTSTHTATGGTDCSAASVEAGVDFAHASGTVTFAAQQTTTTDRIDVTTCTDLLA